MFSRARYFDFYVIFCLPFSRGRDNVSLLVFGRSVFLLACLQDCVISYFLGLCIVRFWLVSSRVRCLDFSVLFLGSLSLVAVTTFLFWSFVLRRFGCLV